MAEEGVKNARDKTKVALDARAEMETELGALKEKHTKMAEQLKEAVRERDSVEAGLKTTERQFEEVRKELHCSEINLATEKQMVTELCEELRKARDYCDISWGKALDAAGILSNSSLRRLESIYYDPDIYEFSGPSSSHSTQPAQVSEVPTTDQAPPAPVETSIDPHPDVGKAKEAETPQGKDKGKGRASDTTISQPEQVVDPEAPKSQV